MQEFQSAAIGEKIEPEPKLCKIIELLPVLPVEPPFRLKIH